MRLYPPLLCILGLYDLQPEVTKMIGVPILETLQNHAVKTPFPDQFQKRDVDRQGSRVLFLIPFPA
jgi:hypothetical protein